MCVLIHVLLVQSPLPANLLIALPIPTPQNTNLWPHCQRVILPPHTCLQPRSTCSTLGFGTFIPPKKKRRKKKTNNHVSPPHLNGATDRSDIVEEQITTYIFPPLSLGFNRNDVNAFPPENTWQHTNKKKTKQQKKHQQNKRWLYKKEPKYKWLYPAPQCVLGTMLGRASTLRGKNSPTPHFL